MKINNTTFISLLLVIALLISWTCSLEKIDPSVKFDPCLGKVTSKFTHDKIGITCDSPCIVKFTNQSTGAKSYIWDFGEGGSSTETNPTYTFKKTGRFEVKLTATSDNSCINTSTEAVVVSRPNLPDPIPDFIFTFKNGNQFATATVVFTNTSQNAVKYKWSFASSNDSSTQVSPEYTYALAQNFNVKLEAINAAGVSRQTVKTVTIKAQMFTKFYTLSALGSSGKDIITTNDGGYAVAGETGGTGSLNALKVDSKGNSLWNKEFPTADISAGYGLTQASDGGIVTVGANSVNTGNLFNLDVHIVKFDPITGGTVWSKLIGGTKNDSGNSIEKTSDGGFIICGYSASQINGNGKEDIYLVKTNALGDIQWSKPFGDTSVDRGINAKQTADGGFIVLGKEILKNKETPILIKTDASGNKTWSKFLNIDVNLSTITHMTKTSDGGYVFCGYNNPSPSRAIAEFMLHKTDSLGNKQWQQKFGDSRPLYASHVEQCTDGGYIVCGNSSTIYSNAESFIYLIKFDSNGTKLWDKSVVGGAGASVKQTPDGGFVVVGNAYTASGVGTLVIKTDKDGNYQ